jgi:hypothetical protein
LIRINSIRIGKANGINVEHRHIDAIFSGSIATPHQNVMTGQQPAEASGSAVWLDSYWNQLSCPHR